MVSGGRLICEVLQNSSFWGSFSRVGLYASIYVILGDTLSVDQANCRTFLVDYIDSSLYLVDYIDES